MTAKSNVRTDNEDNKFVEDSNNHVAVNTTSEITNDSNNPVPTNPLSGSLLQGVVFDYIDTSFPNTVTEVYEYRNGGVGGSLEATITVIYTDASKKTISSVART